MEDLWKLYSPSDVGVYGVGAFPLGALVPRGHGGQHFLASLRFAGDQAHMQAPHALQTPSSPQFRRNIMPGTCFSRKSLGERPGGGLGDADGPCYGAPEHRGQHLAHGFKIHHIRCTFFFEMASLGEGIVKGKI